MKKILAIALFILSSTAMADVWVMKNQGGGEITLTSDRCKADNYAYPDLKNAYTWTNQVYQEGCWALIDGNVHVTWINSNGSRNRMVYPPSSFTKKSTY